MSNPKIRFPMVAATLAISLAGSVTTAEPKHESPFACSRTALSDAERKRHFEELGPALRAVKRAVRELPDGYEFEFPADAVTWQRLTEWSFQERRCCPFFDVGLRLEREDGGLWLRLGGRPGTKAFIEEEARSWIEPRAQEFGED